jgi:hypothetical protein
VAVTPISNLIRTQIYSRLADPNTGLSPLYAQGIEKYGLKIGKLKIPMNMAIGGRQVVFGATNPLIQEGTSSFTYPFVSIYSHGIVNRNLNKFTKFSGDVVMGIDFWISWTSDLALPDTESYGDAAEEAVVEIINGFGSDLGATEQNWGLDVVYNGGVSLSRTDLTLAGANWLQGLKFRLTFQIDTM